VVSTGPEWDPNSLVAENTLAGIWTGDHRPSNRIIAGNCDRTRPARSPWVRKLYGDEAGNRYMAEAARWELFGFPRTSRRELASALQSAEIGCIAVAGVYRNESMNSVAVAARKAGAGPITDPPAP